jgi:Domain of unknown function (DUF4410)
MKWSLWLLVAVMCVAQLLSGCATSPGGINPVSPLKAGTNLTTFSNLALEVQADSGVTLSPTDKERISRLIVDTIKKKGPNRFADINAPAPAPSTLRASVNVTRYDKGNSFARFMLAGLGQMHIDAHVVLEDQATQNTLGRYEVTKTFAWGGIYGAVTRIDDVEEGFASAVAALILGADDR